MRCGAGSRARGSPAAARTARRRSRAGSRSRRPARSCRRSGSRARTRPPARRSARRPTPPRTRTGTRPPAGTVRTLQLTVAKPSPAIASVERNAYEVSARGRVGAGRRGAALRLQLGERLARRRRQLAVHTCAQPTRHALCTSPRIHDWLSTPTFDNI